MTLPERTRDVGALLLLAAILGLGLYVKVDVTRHLDPELRPYLSDADGSLYFYTHDSFLYYRMSRNVLDHGHAGESLRAGKAWDDLTFAPKGRPSSPSLLAWVQALAYRVTPSGVSLLAAACFLPAVLSCAVVLFLFLLGLDLGGLRCGLAGALIAALHPEMAAHCHVGLSDTTPLNLLFLAAGTWALLRTLKAIDQSRYRKTAVYGSVLGLDLFLFRETWTAWTSLLFLVVGVGAVWLGLRAFQRVSSRRWKVLLAACAPLFVLLGTWAALSSPLGSRLLAYSERQQAALFPSGLDQVRELLPLTVPELVDHLGGIVLLVLAGLGLVLGVSRRRDRRVELSALLAWLLPAAAAGCFSYRFVVFAVPPLVVLAALGLTLGSDLLSGWIRPAWRQGLRGVVAGAAVTFLLLAYQGELLALRARRPIADRAMVETAERIRASTVPEAVINTWWSSGYVYSALAGRGVVLDGGSLAQERIYWYSRALTATDEGEALSLLRWIDCGVEGYLLDLLSLQATRAEAALTMAELARVPTPRERHAFLRRKGYSSANVKAIGETLACRPAQAWMVLSSDLLGQTAAWARYGLWTPADGPLPPPSASVTQPLACSLVPGGFTCANGRTVDILRDGWRDFTTPGHLAAMGPAEDGWRPVVHQVRDLLALTYVREEIADSLFARLYFFRGSGLPRFQLMSDIRYPPFTRRVLSYRIEWPETSEGSAATKELR